jgi:hypothetical protein
MTDDEGGLDVVLDDLPDASSESETARNGAFSYATEFHAFAIGVLVGFAAVLPSRRLRRFAWDVVGIEGDARSDALREAKAKSWYAAGGVLVGALVGLLVETAALVAVVFGAW